MSVYQVIYVAANGERLPWYVFETRDKAEQFIKTRPLEALATLNLKRIEIQPWRLQ